MKDREQIAQALAASGYIADSELATAISLMPRLRRPLRRFARRNDDWDEIRAPLPPRASRVAGRGRGHMR
jgi:hypothetical protein